MPESLYWQKRFRYRCFLTHFKRYLRCRFYWTPPGDCFCSTEKYFTNKIVKSALKKEKKVATAGKKNNSIRRKKTETLLINSPYPFIIQKFLYFLFSGSQDTLKAQVFRNNAMPSSKMQYIFHKKMLYLGIFRLRFEKIIAIFQTSTLEFFNMRSFMQK